MNDEIMKAILAMDAYNQGGGAAIVVNQENIGLASVYKDSDDFISTAAPSVFADFYAISYNYEGQKVISYRGTDDPVGGSVIDGDLWNGWFVGGGSTESRQGELAFKFYQEVVGGIENAFSANISLTGHSLGGGLAGLVGGVYGKKALMYDNMPFEAALQNTINITSDTVPTEDFNADLRQLVYGNGAALAENTTNIANDTKTISVIGEVLQPLRTFQSTPKSSLDLGPDVDLIPDTQLASYIQLYGLASAVVGLAASAKNAVVESVARHSQATLVIRQFAETELNGVNDWEDSALYFWPVLYNNDFANNIGVADDSISGLLKTDGKYSDILRGIIAYSAIDEGVRVFGDTGIRALYDDANDLGGALQIANSGSILEAQAENVSKAFVAYAGQLALQKILSDGNDDPVLDGILTLTNEASQHSLAMDMTFDSWYGQIGFGALAARDHVRELMFDAILTGTGKYDKIYNELSQTYFGNLYSTLNTAVFALKPSETSILDQSSTSYYVGTQGVDFTEVSVTGGSTIQFGMAGNDILRGGDSVDFLYGGEGQDELYGGGYNDTLLGGEGNDHLYGEGGNDTFIGGEGNNIIWGGDGRNTIVYEDFNTLTVSYSTPGWTVGHNRDSGSYFDSAYDIDTVIAKQYKATNILDFSLYNTSSGITFEDREPFHYETRSDVDVITSSEIEVANYSSVVAQNFGIILGTSNNDTFRVNSVTGRSFDGRNGTDFLHYKGADNLFGVTFDADANTVTSRDGSGVFDTISNFENIQLTPYSDIVDVSVNNSLSSIAGMGGDDTYTVRYNLGQSFDYKVIFNGGSGEDTIRFSGGSEGLSFTSEYNSDIINDFENVILGSGNDTISIKVNHNTAYDMGGGYDTFILDGVASYGGVWLPADSSFSANNFYVDGDIVYGNGEAKIERLEAVKDASYILFKTLSVDHSASTLDYSLLTSGIVFDNANSSISSAGVTKTLLGNTFNVIGTAHNDIFTLERNLAPSNSYLALGAGNDVVDASDAFVSNGSSDAYNIRYSYGHDALNGAVVRSVYLDEGITYSDVSSPTASNLRFIRAGENPGDEQFDYYLADVTLSVSGRGSIKFNDIVTTVLREQTSEKYYAGVPIFFSNGDYIENFEYFHDVLDVELEANLGNIYGDDNISFITESEGLDLDFGLGDDVVTGSNFDDVIRGGLGNDVLRGEAGDDRFYGGIGNDDMYGGTGGDWFYGGAGFDRVFYSSNFASNDVSIYNSDVSINDGNGWDTIFGDVEQIVFADGIYENGVFKPTDNNDPTAVNDTAIVDEDEYVSIEVLSNDHDDDGDTLTVSALSSPSNGTAVFGEDGVIVYTPNANYHGRDSFQYTIDDGLGGTATATVQVTVNPVNDLPVAKDDFFDGVSGFQISGNVLSDNGSGADVDIDGDTLNVVSGTFATMQNGLVSLNSNGSFTYISASGFSGTDVFIYTVRDPSGASDTALMTFNIAEADGPIAVNGTTGADRFYAALVDEAFDGISGWDEVRYDNSNAGINVDLETGVNTGGYAQGDTFANIDAVFGSHYDDVMNGSDAANQLRGNNGNDTLDGKLGNDRLFGNNGNDTYIFTGGNDQFHEEGTGSEVIIFDAIWAPEDVSVNGNILTFDAQNQVMFNDINLFETFRFNSHADMTLAQLIAYMPSNAVDVIGTTGFDRFYAASEAEAFDGAGGWNEVRYDNSIAGVNIDLATGVNTGGYAQGDSFVDIDVVFGSHYNDVIRGNDLNNQLRGNGGNDIMDGGLGWDRLYGDAGDDVYKFTGGGDTYFETGAGNDAVEFSSDWSPEDVSVSGNVLTFDGSNKITFNDISLFEIFRFDGHVDMSLTELLNYTPSGTIDVIGTAGFDRFYATASSEAFDGAGGWNEVRYDNASESVSVNLISGIHTGSYAAGDNFTDIDAVFGSHYNDVLRGSGGSEQLRGNSGDDVLYVTGGIDNLFGGSGADSFIFESVGAYDGIDNVRDFDLSEGDILNIADLLSGYDAVTDAITDFVQITDNGTDASVAVDSDGGADNFVTIATLYGATGLTDEEALETSGNLVTI